MNKPKRIALIGAGNMGKYHARVLSYISDAKLVAVVDTNIAKAESIANRYSCAYFRSINELISSKTGMDGAIIATPTPQHKNCAIELIDRSIPLLIEKPIASSTKEANVIAQEAQKKGVLITVGHTEHYNPAVHKLKEILFEHKLIGDVISIHSNRLGKKKDHNPQKNVVCEIGVHDFDVFATLAGGFDNLSAHPIWIKKEKDNIMAAIVNISGARFAGILQFSWISNYKIRTLYAIGTKAMVEMNYISQKITLINGNISKYAQKNTPASFSEFILQFGEPQRADISLKRKEPLAVELKDFIRSISTGNNPQVGITEGLRALALAEQGSSIIR